MSKSLEEYRTKRRQDPEYRKVERRLKPWLDFLDAMFYVKMWLRRLLATARDFCWSAWLSLPTEDVEL